MDTFPFNLIAKCNDATPKEIEAIVKDVCPNSKSIVKDWVSIPERITKVEMQLQRIADNTSHLFFLFAGMLLLIVIFLATFMFTTYMRIRR